MASKKNFQVVSSEGITMAASRTASINAKKKHITASSGYSMRTASANTLDSQYSSFYSPTLSTDYLELPHDIREKRQFFRHFATNNEVVSRAVEIHTDQPISKTRLAMPKSTNSDYAEYVLDFFERMASRLKLTQRLLDIAYEMNVFANAWIFAEDQEDGTYSNTEPLEGDDGSELKYKFDKNIRYNGWSRLIVLPPDSIEMKTFGFTDKVIIELKPSDEDRRLIQNGVAGAPEEEKEQYQDVIESMPDDVKEYVSSGKNIPLNTDPYEGSFCFHMKGRSSQYEPLGYSRLDRCLRTLIYWDKLRQAQTQIASRAMTPKRIVWAENMSAGDVDDLRDQIDMSMVDPDYTIIANFELNYNQIGANDRLLQLNSEYEMVLEQLLAGLGITRDLLTGEGSYTGTRISLEVMNQQYLRFREVFQDYVEEYIFKPVAKKKGFWDTDRFGNKILLYPRLEFTRLSIRDNVDTFDQLLTLYQKGSLPLETILEFLNINPDASRKMLRRDVGTLDDANTNEASRAMYMAVGQRLADETNLFEKLVAAMDLEVRPSALQEAQGDAGGGRF